MVNQITKTIILERTLDVKSDGSFRLNMKYFNFSTGYKMTNENFEKLFGQKVRDPNKELNTISYGYCIFNSGCN